MHLFIFLKKLNSNQTIIILRDNGIIMYKSKNNREKYNNIFLCLVDKPNN